MLIIGGKCRNFLADELYLKNWERNRFNLWNFDKKNFERGLLMEEGFMERKKEGKEEGKQIWSLVVGPTNGSMDVR